MVRPPPTGLTGADDLDLLGRDRLETGLEAVRFRRPGGGVLRVLLRAARTADPRLLTCHSTRAESPLRFTLLELAAERLGLRPPRRPRSAGRSGRAGAGCGGPASGPGTTARR